MSVIPSLADHKTRCLIADLIPGQVQLYVRGRCIYVRANLTEHERNTVEHIIEVEHKKHRHRVRNKIPFRNMGVGGVNQVDTSIWMVGSTVHFKRSVKADEVTRLQLVLEGLATRFSPKYDPRSYFRVFQNGTVQLVDHRKRKLDELDWDLRYWL